MTARDGGAEVGAQAREVVGASPDTPIGRQEFEIGFVLVPLGNAPQETVVATLLFPFRPVAYDELMLPATIQEDLIAALDG